MKSARCFIVGLAATTCLVGCGGGGGGNGYNYVDTSSVSYNQSNPVGSIDVVVTNTNLPTNTASIAYTVVDTPTGETVYQQTFAYSGGVPAAQTITNVPTDSELVTVQALDASNNVLLQSQSTVSVTDGNTLVDTVTLGADAATGLTFTNWPFNVVASSSLPTLVVAETDVNGNLAVGATDTITLSLGSNPGNAALGGPLTVTAVNGLAQFPGVSLSQIGTGYTLMASANGLTTATSGNFNVLASAGPATQLLFSVEPFTTVGVNQVLSPAPQVVEEDNSGTVVSSANDAITLSIATNAGSASIAGQATQVANQGISTFNGISLTAAGVGYTLQAAGASLVPTLSSSFSVTP